MAFLLIIRIIVLLLPRRSTIAHFFLWILFKNFLGKQKDHFLKIAFLSSLGFCPKNSFIPMA
jgi:hypothetical protein